LRDNRTGTNGLKRHFQNPNGKKSSRRTDIVSTAKRSEIMGRIRGKNTKPEVLVRKILRSLGCPYKQNVGSLPGTPDIVLPRRKLAIFVHGCFWHGHRLCAKGTTLPKTRRDFWQAKILRNTKRDRAAVRDLHRAGWSVLKLWECQLRDADRVSSHLAQIVGGEI
jgi:DNA mismatch endonuclease (patch repair protein)